MQRCGGEAKRAQLFACKSLSVRLREAATIVLSSDAASDIPRIAARGRRRLLDLGWARRSSILSSVSSSVMVIVAIFAGLLAYQWTKK
jgi:hypothetical protein